MANLGSDLKNARVRIRTRARARIHARNAVWQGRAAQRQADQGERLFERSATQRVRARPRLPRAAQEITKRSAVTLTSARLFFAYFLLAKQKNSRSPAAATERHRNLSNHRMPDSSKGFDRLSPNGKGIHPL